MRRLLAASLVATGLFYIEYTDLWRKVHIPYDIEGYHYSLANATFLALKAKQIPLWDAGAYSGIPLAGNIQAQLFYPPAWTLHAAYLRTADRLPYAAVEMFLMAHIWLSFALFHLWLARGRGLHPVAAMLGAAVFAFGGYACAQITHLGLICNYAWFPLGFWGVDDIASGSTRRGVVKVAAAAALGFLAGYPSTWICQMVCIAGYALASVRPARSAAWTGVALAWSIALGAVQLLPTLEAAPLKEFDPKYGWNSGLKDISKFYTMVAPNFYDFDFGADLAAFPGKDCFYLGGFGLAGLLLFAIGLRGAWRQSLPVIGALAGTLVFLLNPGTIPGVLIERSPTLAQLFTDWYFLAGLFAALAALSAIGADHFLRLSAGRRRIAGWWIPAAAAFCWSAYLLSIWGWRWRSFATGWASAADAAVACALTLALLASMRFTSANRALPALALVVLGFADFKAFGTSRRLNTDVGASNAIQTKDRFAGFSDEAWKHIVASRPMRVTVDDWGPAPTDWRHTGVAVVNGFDPFIPTAYRQLIESRKGVFRSNRLFNLPRDAETLRLFGVGFYITAEASPLYRELMGDANFELYESQYDYNKVFKLKGASPPYAHSGGAGASIRVERWIPERRRFEVTSEAAGTFRLSEQFYPGWRVAVDRKPAGLFRCETAFQCVAVPAGRHLVEFAYRPQSVVMGLAISLVAALGLVGFGAQPHLRRLDPRPARAWAEGAWRMLRTRESEPANSRPIARLAGPMLAALAAAELWNPRIWEGAPAAAIHLRGALLLLGGLAMVLAHNHWTRGWPVILTLAGWMAIGGGLAGLFGAAAAWSGGWAAALALATGALLSYKAYGDR